MGLCDFRDKSNEMFKGLERKHEVEIWGLKGYCEGITNF